MPESEDRVVPVPTNPEQLYEVAHCGQRTGRPLRGRPSWSVVQAWRAELASLVPKVVAQMVQEP